MPRLAAAVIAVVAFLVACSPGQPTGSSPVATADSADKPLATGTSTVASTTPPISVPPTTTTTPPAYVPPPYPLDGTNLQACTDGACQVSVMSNATIDVGAGRPTFSVVEITSNSIAFHLRYPAGNQASLTLENGDFAPFGPPMSFEISLDQANGDGTAIVNVEPYSR